MSYACLIVCYTSVFRRNTSVDESYEWDATECPVGLDLLEAMKMERMGVGRSRELRQDRPHSTTGLQDLQEKGESLYDPQPPDCIHTVTLGQM